MPTTTLDHDTSTLVLIEDTAAQARELRSLGMHAAAKTLEAQAASLRRYRDRRRAWKQIIDDARQAAEPLPGEAEELVQARMIGWLAERVLSAQGGA